MKGSKEEFFRRHAASTRSLERTARRSDSVVPALKARDPSQKYAVVHLANQKSRPYSKTPAVRVMGVFPSLRAANKHALLVHSHIPQCTVQIVETWAWNLISVDETTGIAERSVKVDRLLLRYFQGILDAEQEFESRRSQCRSNEPTLVNKANNPSFLIAKQEVARLVEKLGQSEAKEGAQSDSGSLPPSDSGALPPSGAERPSGSEAPSGSLPPSGAERPSGSEAPSDSAPFVESKAEADVEEETYSLTPQVTRVPGQRFVAVSFLEDVEFAGSSDRSEPAFCILGAFDTVGECDGYDDAVLQNVLPEHDIACVDMYGWVFPSDYSGVEKSDITKYRFNEQNLIMNAPKKVKRELDAYKSSQSVLGKDVQPIDIEPDLQVDEAGDIVYTESKASANESSEYIRITVEDEKGDGSPEERKEGVSPEERKE